jgi:hypothetical protein
MMITGTTNSGWPRLCTLGDGLTKEQYRSLQGGGTEDVGDIIAAHLVALGVARVAEGEGE